MLPEGFDSALHLLQKASPASRFELPCIVHTSLGYGHKIEIGAFSLVAGGGGSSLGAARIGRFCSIAAGCVISPDEHPTNWLSTSILQYVPNANGWGDAARRMGSDFNAPTCGFEANRSVSIGHDVWIGAGAFVRSGIVIGDGAIVAAGSVVVKDVAPYHIVGGNPARVIRARFDGALIARMQRVQWWKYDVFRIPTLNFSQVGQALDLIERAIEHRIVSIMTPPCITLAELLESQPP